MRTVMLLALCAGVALMGGCGAIVSIQPLYTEKELVADLPLEGNWTDTDGEEVWSVAISGKGYSVRQTQGEQTHVYHVHLLRLGDDRFLDITTPEHSELSVPGHLFAKVRMEGDELRIALIDSDWLKKKITESRALAHVEVGLEKESGVEYLLTASTKELQEFVRAHAAEPKAFEADPERLRRVR